MKYLSTTNKIYIYETRNYAKNGGLSDQPGKRGFAIRYSRVFDYSKIERYSIKIMDATWSQTPQYVPNFRRGKSN